MMSRNINLTVNDAAYEQFIAVQGVLTENRRLENPRASKANQSDTLEWILLHATNPADARARGSAWNEHRTETIDNCMRLGAELRGMGFTEDGTAASVIGESKLAEAACAIQPTTPGGLAQARYSGIYLVSYGFLEACGGGEYRLTGKDRDVQNDER